MAFGARTGTLAVGFVGAAVPPRGASILDVVHDGPGSSFETDATTQARLFALVSHFASISIPSLSTGTFAIASTLAGLSKSSRCAL